MTKSTTFRSWALAALAALALGACNRDWDTGRAALAGAGSAAPATAQDAMGMVPGAGGQGLQAGAAGARAAFAALPDRGDLVGYPQDRVVRREGAYTWHRADVSEEHALRAIVDGELRITAPDGQLLAFEYERHVEHPTGDWTWIGRLRDAPPGRQAILTFGAKAVFGSIAQSAAAPLGLEMRDGASWLVETDPALLAEVEQRVLRPEAPDFLLPPVYMGSMSGPKALGDTVTSSGPSVESSSSTSSSTTTVVDVLVGYTTGFATAQGGDSQARTRINFLIDVGNQAYVNSQIDARVRLVHAMQVSYPDATENAKTLEKLTGYVSGHGKTTPDPAFSALRNARETYGADLVTLVRKFTDPENDGCGIAWLIGGGLTTIHSGYEYFGYSVVSDGIDQGDDGKNYTCRLETMVHEFGHNMGSAHDVETAKGEDGVLQTDEYGRYAYSFGYKTGPGAGDFFTIMAYRDKRDSGPQQQAYQVFSNPDTTFCGTYPCGTSNADNARSLRQTMPIIASFRDTAVQAGSSQDLFTIKRQGRQGTEVHVLEGGTNFQTFALHTATALHRTGSSGAWKFRFGDYNRDGVLDLYVIKKTGSSGKTEVHILNGADRFKSFLLHAATALHQTGNDESWLFDLGDYNGDGHLDLYVIKRNGRSGRTEVHVLNGANRFQSFLLHAATALHSTGNDHGWKFELADYNNDGILDLYVIKKQGSSGFTELHVMNGASRFGSYLLHRATALHATGTDNTWEFKLGDHDGDGVQDIFAIMKQGSSGRTEVYVLDGASSYRTFSLSEVTALHSTGTDGSWEFELGVYSK